MRLFLYLILSLLCFNVNAQCDQSENDGLDSGCTTVGQWHFSVALGIGEKSNPIEDGQDIPLYIVPLISYYGEQWFFDNDTLGYSYFIDSDLTFSIISKFNENAANFYRWRPSSTFIVNNAYSNSDWIFDDVAPVTNINGSANVDDSRDEEVTISINDISTRKWALDAGIQLDYIINSTTHLQFELLHDISRVYDGLNANIKVEKIIIPPYLEKLTMVLTVGFEWQSAALNNYYYGISLTEAISEEQDSELLGGSLNQMAKTPLNSRGAYQAGSGINQFIGSIFRYQLSRHWQGLVALKVSKQSKQIVNSPLVNKSEIKTVFFGFAYDF